MPACSEARTAQPVDLDRNSQTIALQDCPRLLLVYYLDGRKVQSVPECVISVYSPEGNSFDPMINSLPLIRVSAVSVSKVTLYVDSSREATEHILVNV